MFLYTTIYFCYFLQHKTRTTHIASKRTVFCKVFAFFSVYFSCDPQKRYLLTCLITVLKDRLNLSLNDPICHHFKLSVRLYVSHYLGKKKWAKTSSKYSIIFHHNHPDLSFMSILNVNFKLHRICIFSLILRLN